MVLNMKSGDESNVSEGRLDSGETGAVQNSDKKPEAPLTADFVERGKRFVLESPMSSMTGIAAELATATPNRLSEEVAVSRAHRVSETGWAGTKNQFRQRPYTSSSLNSIALFTAVFIIGFTAFAFAFGVSAELIDMIF